MSAAQKPAFQEARLNQVPNLISINPAGGTEACIANISTAERRKRLTIGIVAFVVGIVLLAVLMATGANVWFRLPLFLLFAMAASGYFQWHDKTCVALASANSRKIGDKMEKIEDATELLQVKSQARRVQMKIGAAAVVLTIIALALPSLM